LSHARRFVWYLGECGTPVSQINSDVIERYRKAHLEDGRCVRTAREHRNAGRQVWRLLWENGLACHDPDIPGWREALELAQGLTGKNRRTFLEITKEFLEYLQDEGIDPSRIDSGVLESYRAKLIGGGYQRLSASAYVGRGRKLWRLLWGKGMAENDPAKERDFGGWEEVQGAYKEITDPKNRRKPMVKKFMRYLKETGTPLTEINREVLRGYREALQKQGVPFKAKYACSKEARRVWRWLYDEGKARHSPYREKEPWGWELVQRREEEALATGERKGVRMKNRHCVRAWLVYLESVGIEPETASEDEAWGYQKYLLEKANTRHQDVTEFYAANLKRVTITGYMGEAKRFCAWLVKIGKMGENPFEWVKFVEREKHVFALMKEQELGEYLEVLGRWWEGHKTAWAGNYRCHVVAEVQYASGLRLEELAELEEEDVDWENALVNVKRGKGGDGRVAYLNEYSLEVLRGFVKNKKLLYPWATGSRLFGLSRDGLISCYNQRLDLIAKALGKPGWSSHKFRHSLGYHLLRSGCSIRYVQQILGHKRLKSTEVYTKVDIEDTRAVLDAFHPRGGE
jgi:integrase/recombinase XerC